MGFLLIKFIKFWLNLADTFIDIYFITIIIVYILLKKIYNRFIKNI